MPDSGKEGWTLVEGKRRSKRLLHYACSTKNSGSQNCSVRPTRDAEAANLHKSTRGVGEGADDRQKSSLEQPKVLLDESNVTYVAGRISSLRKEILQSTFWRSFKQGMESLQARLREEGEKTGFSSEVGPAQAFFGQFAEVIVLGLGSVDNEFTSRFQLAFALELSRHFGGVPIRIRDPCFRDADQKILHSLGCQVLSNDEQALKKATKATFFYMPHLPCALVHNLLILNWTSGLSNLCILGNSFEGIYEQSTSSIRYHFKSQAVVDLVDCGSVLEELLEDGEDFRSAFSGQSLVTFARCASESTSLQLEDLSLFLESTPNISE